MSSKSSAANARSKAKLGPWGKEKLRLTQNGHNRYTNCARLHKMRKLHPGYDALPQGQKNALLATERQAVDQEVANQTAAAKIEWMAKNKGVDPDNVGNNIPEYAPRTEWDVNPLLMPIHQSWFAQPSGMSTFAARMAAKKLQLAGKRVTGYDAKEEAGPLSDGRSKGKRKVMHESGEEEGSADVDRSKSKQKTRHGPEEEDEADNEEDIENDHVKRWKESDWDLSWAAKYAEISSQRKRQMLARIDARAAVSLGLPVPEEAQAILDELLISLDLSDGEDEESHASDITDSEPEIDEEDEKASEDEQASGSDASDLLADDAMIDLDLKKAKHDLTSLDQLSAFPAPPVDSDREVGPADS